MLPGDGGQWAERQQELRAARALRLAFEGWIPAFYVLALVVLLSSLGLKPISGAIILVTVAGIWGASKICSGEGMSYWRSLRAVAALNVTGDVRFGQFLVMPLLLVATVYSVGLVAASLFMGREPAQRAWFAFVLRVNGIAGRFE